MRQTLLLLSLLIASLLPGSLSGNAPGAIIVVAKDGTGDVRSVQEAFDAVPDSSDRWTEIVIRSGRYREKLRLPPSKRRVFIRAEVGGEVLLTYDDHTGRIVGADTINTRTSYSCSLEGDDLIIDGIVFENAAGRVGQAVALQITGDRVAVFRSVLRGDQDTFFARGTGRIYLRECEIEGTTDFIFGPAVALFDRCLIRSKKDSYITAASTPAGNTFGFVFRECTLVAPDSIRRVYLGRPWRPYAKTVFLRCRLDGHILPEGWHNWSKPEAERTSFYAEYKNFGSGADRSGRVSWSTELTDSAAAAYTLHRIFAASGSATGYPGDWLPPDPPGSFTPGIRGSAEELSNSGRKSVYCLRCVRGSFARIGEGIVDEEKRHGSHSFREELDEKQGEHRALCRGMGFRGSGPAGRRQSRESF